VTRYELIRDLLRTEDIEDLIALGSPDDEYDTEARMIAEDVRTAEWKQDDPLTHDQVRDIVVRVWMKMFGISDEDAKKRMSQFDSIAARIQTFKKEQVRY
jgi:hypothetical protein